MIVNSADPPSRDDTNKQRVRVALVVKPVCPSGASRSIVGNGTVAFTVPRDAPPTRPPGAPRCGGLYAGSGGGPSSGATAGASFCATAGGGTRHIAAITVASFIVNRRLTANCRSIGTAPNRLGAHSAGQQPVRAGLLAARAPSTECRIARRDKSR